VNEPGVTATLVAPETDQLKVLLDPEAMLDGFDEKDVIFGAEFCWPGMVWEVAEPAQPARAAQQTSAQRRAQIGAQTCNPTE